MSGWDELDRERDMAAARAVGYLEGMSALALKEIKERIRKLRGEDK